MTVVDGQIHTITAKPEHLDLTIEQYSTGRISNTCLVWQAVNAAGIPVNHVGLTALNTKDLREFEIDEVGQDLIREFCYHGDRSGMSHLRSILPISFTLTEKV